MPLVQCPTCQAVHKAKRDRSRWHCVECGTLWDASGRIVTGRPFKRDPASDANLKKGKTHPKKQRQEEREPKTENPKKKSSFWDADVL